MSLVVYVIVVDKVNGSSQLWPMDQLGELDTWCKTKVITREERFEIICPCGYGPYDPDDGEVTTIYTGSYFE